MRSRIRDAARRDGVGRIGRVTGIDFSPAMLAVAQTKPALRDAASIDYHKAPADRLPVADAEFDVAICQHGLQFFPDRAAALAETRRALRVGGRMGIAVWADIEQSPAFAALEDVIREVAGDELADRYRGGPWNMPDADQVRELLEESGFDDVRITRGCSAPALRMRGSASLHARRLGSRHRARRAVREPTRAACPNARTKGGRQRIAPRRGRHAPRLGPPISPRVSRGVVRSLDRLAT